VISARKVQHNSTDNQVQTSCEGESDDLVIVPIPTKVRKKNQKLKTGGRPSYDARYRDKDGSYRALLCEFSFTLCTSDGTAKTTFMHKENVCVKLDVQNPFTGEILLGMRPNADYGGKGLKSFFGDTGVRIEIDDLEQARIARLRGTYALNLGAGKSYTFFRTLVNGDGKGDREGNNMYRVHFPLKPGTYTARLWIADRKTSQTASFDILN